MNLRLLHVSNHARHGDKVKMLIANFLFEQDNACLNYGIFVCTAQEVVLIITALCKHSDGKKHKQKRRILLFQSLNNSFSKIS